MGGGVCPAGSSAGEAAGHVVFVLRRRYETAVNRDQLCEAAGHVVFVLRPGVKKPLEAEGLKIIGDLF